jgi:hypothetical protein
MKTKTLYVVRYNDCYGNGDTYLEVIVESKDDFKKWLKQHNEDRQENGEIEEYEEEFDLIPLELFN